MSKLTVRIIGVLALLATGEIGGCGREQTPAVPPVAVSAAPMTAATGVAFNAVITATITTSTFTLAHCACWKRTSCSLISRIRSRLQASPADGRTMRDSRRESYSASAGIRRHPARRWEPVVRQIQKWPTPAGAIGLPYARTPATPRTTF
jgi:hypothetical protein